MADRSEPSVSGNGLPHDAPLEAMKAQYLAAGNLPFAGQMLVALEKAARRDRDRLPGHVQLAPGAPAERNGSDRFARRSRDRGAGTDAKPVPCYRWLIHTGLAVWP